LEIFKNKAPSVVQIIQAVGEEFSVHYLPNSDEVSEKQLLVEISQSADEHTPLTMELMMLPDDDDIYFLQLFAALPYEVLKEQISEVCRLIVSINTQLPLIGFGMLEESSLIFFRCVVPCPLVELNADSILNSIYVIQHSIQVLGPVVSKLANGTCSFEEAIRSASVSMNFKNN
jgi:hypothetical protein